MRNGLRSELLRAMVVTLVLVTAATVLTVGYVNCRGTRFRFALPLTLDAIATREPPLTTTQRVA